MTDKITTEEAIKRLEKSIACMEAGYTYSFNPINGCLGCDSYVTNEHKIEASKAAIEALEYRKAKKPYHIHNVPYVWFCPTCNEQCDWTVSAELLNKPDFCPNCGQRLDWSDEE